MEHDLLFTFIEKENWKSFSENGFFEPFTLEDQGFIKCFEGKNAEKIANLDFSDQPHLLLLVIDPLRIHVPIKKFDQPEVEYLHVQGKFSIDAIIDRIPIKKSKKGKFNINIKHFD